MRKALFLFVHGLKFMEKIRIVIVEDEFPIAEDMLTHLELQGYSVTAIFDSAEKALPALQDDKPDILLVDIKLLGAMDGIELVEELQKTMKFPLVYITANSNPGTYQKARKTSPNAFLIKPFSHLNLLSAIDLALQNYADHVIPPSIERLPADSSDDKAPWANRSLFIRTNGKYRKISPGEILFVEASGSYIHIQTITDRYTLSQNLSNFQRKTPLQNLVRIHRSYLVNIDKVDSFEESSVFVHTHKLPLSDHYRADFMRKIRCI